MKSRLIYKGKYFAGCILVLLFLSLYKQAAAQIDLERIGLIQRLDAAREDTLKVADLLALARNYIWRRPRNKNALDSAKLLIDQGSALSKKLNYIKGIGESIQEQASLAQVQNDKQKALGLYNIAADIFKKNKLVANEAKVYLELAYMTGNTDGKVERKIQYLNQSLTLYKQVNSKKDIGRILQELADINMLQYKQDTALVLLKQSLIAYQEAGAKDLQGLYSIFGTLYFQKGDFTSSLKYSLLAAKTAEELNDSSEHLIAIYRRIGDIYNYSGDMAQAFPWFEKAKHTAINYNDTESVALINTSVSEGLILSNRIKESIDLLHHTERSFSPKSFAVKVRLNLFLIRSYVYAGKAEKAVTYFNQMVHWYDSLPHNDVEKNEIVTEIIEYLHETGQYQRAYPYMEVYKKFSQQSNDLMQLINVEGMYFTADSGTGNFKGALMHYKMYKNYIDSLNGVERIKQLDDLQVKYETDKKQKNLELLTQQNKAQLADAEKQKLIRNIIVGAAILLVLLLGFNYRRYRRKQKINMQLQLQQNQINQQNEQLKKLLTDKEWLLKEIHHRVKNNLQIVISLLNTQSAYLDNAAALEAIQNSQHRMHAMSLIHQRLYQSDDMTTIDMKWYIRELIGYIKDCIEDSGRLTFNIDLDEISLDIVQAIPLGLILNESITNAIKYAFPDSKKGEISVSLKWIDLKNCRLVATDNGIGLSPDFDLQTSSSLGMSLMLGLSEQIGGKLLLASENGTKLTLSFPVNQQLKA